MLEATTRAGIVRDAAHHVAGDSAFERLWPRVEQGIDDLAGRVLGLDPAREPRVVPITTDTTGDLLEQRLRLDFEHLLGRSLWVRPRALGSKMTMAASPAMSWRPSR